MARFTKRANKRTEQKPDSTEPPNRPVEASEIVNPEAQETPHEEIETGIDQVVLTETPKRRRKRKQSTVKSETLGADAASIVIQTMSVIGLAVSDEGALNPTEQYLISTCIANMPKSDMIDKAMTYVYPLSGLLGVVTWGARIFSTRRKPVQPVDNTQTNYDLPIQSQDDKTQAQHEAENEAIRLALLNGRANY